ncbi:S41 family peptidase [Myroides odoratus]|uniref:S41 family peptidase n=1 Tax=Myroides odoratus TaxID=256 RepID=UPI0033423175
MNKIKQSVFAVLLFCSISYAQKTSLQELNLDFEQVEKGFPLHWSTMGNEEYKIYMDSVHVKSGHYAVVLESTSKEEGFKALAISLPANYKGKEIRLAGYMKTENVAEGYAGLWVRIDPEVGFDNMFDKGVKGTTDWTAYEIILPLSPEQTDQIVLGGLLVGNGKMWLDNLTVTIDGKTLDDPTLEVFEREQLPADLDREFNDGSTIEISDLSEQVISNLELLGKLWGAIKYYHPEVAKGNYNWDYELFRLLPDYLKVKNIKERDELLVSWMAKYGKLQQCKTCTPTAKEAFLRPDLSWIKQFDASQELQKALQNLYKNRNQGEHYYVGLEPNAENPRFTNEKTYDNMPYPDDGYRLLAVYKYWNMIEYFFPNKHLTDKTWGLVLKEYIPKFLEAKNELEYELAAIQLIGEIQDTHANLWGGGDKFYEAQGGNFAPFKVRFIEGQLVVVDYYNPELAEEAQVKIGDVITHINGETIDSLINRLRSYYPASNEAARLRDIAENVLRSSNSYVSISYQTEGQTKQIDVVLYPKGKLNRYHWYKVDEQQRSFKLLNDNIGYVTLANIKVEDMPEIKRAFKDTKGIIVDIRNYPSAFAVFDLGGWFVDKATPFVKFTKVDINNPGAFNFTPLYEIPKDEEQYKGKLVVLINEYSQSQAEYTAMAFRAGKNTTIVGSTTAGADGNVSSFYLPGGLSTMISGIGVYYPDGTETQRVGIVPDVVVQPTIQGIKEGQDEVLEKAIELINNGEK